MIKKILKLKDNKLNKIVAKIRQYQQAKFIKSVRKSISPEVLKLQKDLKIARKNHRPTKVILKKIYYTNPLHRGLK